MKALKILWYDPANCTIAVSIEGKKYTYFARDWAVINRIVERPVFTFKDLNVIKKIGVLQE